MPIAVVVSGECDGLERVCVALAEAGVRLLPGVDPERLPAALEDGVADVVLCGQGVAVARTCEALCRGGWGEQLPVVVAGVGDVAERCAMLERGVAAVLGAETAPAEQVAVVTGVARRARAYRGSRMAAALAAETARVRRDQVEMLVHDMASPVMTINACFSRIEANPLAWDRIMAAQQAGAEAVDTLFGMLRSLRAAMRAEDGVPPLQVVRTDLAELVGEAVRVARCSDGDRCCVTIASAAAPVLCDRGVMVRVVANLIANACRYAGPDRRVFVEVARNEDGARVSVRDNGPGIEPHCLEMIFDRYVRLADGDGESSSGLGLAFCKEAVERHRGVIGVDSTPGHGSTFWFQLPAAPHAIDAGPAPRDGRDQEAPLSA